MSACDGCGRTAMSEPADAVGHTAYAESDVAQAGSHLSYRWAPVSAQRRTRARSAGSILRELFFVTIAAVIGFAVVLLIRHTPIGKPLFEFGSVSRSRTSSYLLAQRRDAASQTGRPLGSGFGYYLTVDGLIVANNHVVAPASDGPQEPMTIVATR